MAAAFPDETRLLCDAILGTLATHLRMCGYDAAYALDRGVEANDEVLALARAEARTLLTRDADLAARAGEDAILLWTKAIDDQLRELRDAGFELSLDEPTRCSNCNGRLERIEAEVRRPRSTRPTPARKRSGGVGTVGSASGAGATGTTWRGGWRAWGLRSPPISETRSDRRRACRVSRSLYL